MNQKFKMYAAVAYFVAAFVFIVLIMRLPFYYLLGAYIVFGLFFAAAHRDGIMAHIGYSMLANGQTSRAFDIFDKAIARGTKNAGVYLHSAIILLRAGDGQAALERLQKALALSPPLLIEKNIHLTMGSCYWVLGDTEKAIETLEGMRTRYEYVNCHVLTTLGYMYILKEDYDRGLLLTNMALEDEPGSAAAWDNLGQAHYRRRELTEAAAAFEKAVSLKDDLADSHYYLGLLALERNDRDHALICFQKANRCNITALNTVTGEQIRLGLEQARQASES